MQIPCTITREHFPDTDRAGRPYTLEFVHYAHAVTGDPVRTKAHILRNTPAPAEVRTFPRASSRQEPQKARDPARSTVYLDAEQNPAIRVSFGYSHQTRRATQVLGVRGGRVVMEWMTPEQFEANFVESDVPPLVAARALESIGRVGGIDPNALRYLLFALNAPAWRIALNAYGFIVRKKIARIAQDLF
jgi:hypothetical protein